MAIHYHTRLEKSSPLLQGLGIAAMLFIVAIGVWLLDAPGLGDSTLALLHDPEAGEIVLSLLIEKIIPFGILVWFLWLGWDRVSVSIVGITLAMIAGSWALFHDMAMVFIDQGVGYINAMAMAVKYALILPHESVDPLQFKHLLGHVTMFVAAWTLWASWLVLRNEQSDKGPLLASLYVFYHFTAGLVMGFTSFVAQFEFGLWAGILATLMSYLCFARFR